MTAAATVVAFVVLAATGGLVRWRIGAVPRSGLPVGTLGVNVSASFVAGLVASISPTASVVVVTALLGSLSTFSTFTGEVVDLRSSHGPGRAGLYVALTCVAGIGAAWVGLALAG